MAETANIARMAEIIANEIFEEFGWKNAGPMNTNWDCVQTEAHSVASHPSDVVFYYPDPFRGVRMYVQTDLKSYANDTISKSILSKSIVSLSKQLACAEVSDEWRERFTHGHVTYEICGMLFVYNHDGGYDREFADLLETVDTSETCIPEGSKIVVLGPEDVYWLHNVSQEITRMRGRQDGSRLPDRDLCEFFYPQPVRGAFALNGEMSAASLEVLTGPWIIIRFPIPNQQSGYGYIVFYKNDQATTDEFLYLIDFIRQNEMLALNNIIEVKAIDRKGESSNHFQKARQQYIDQLGLLTKNTGIHRAISSIKFSSFRALVPHFSEIEIGMEYDR